MEQFKEIYMKCEEAHEKNNEIIIYGAGLIGHLIYDCLVNKGGVSR